MSEQKKYDDFFNEVFSSDRENQSDKSTGLSPVVRKLKERKNRKIVEHYVSWLKMADGSIQQDSIDDGKLASYTHSLIDKGKHFSLIEDPGVVTIAYQIFKSRSFKAQKRFYFAEKLDSLETILADGRKNITYFVDYPHREGDQVVLLHFDRDGKHVIINSGLLIGDEVRLSLNPCVFEFTPIAGAMLRQENGFDLENLTEEEKADFLNGVSSVGEHDIDADSTIITIDTETFLPVEKRVVLEDGEYKAKINIKSFRNYFSFQIRAEDDADLYLTNFDLAKSYCYGYGDFPKDKIKAAEMFEQIGDAESLYELAHIWLDESHNDVESLQDGIVCLEEAACQGHNSAKAELVYYRMKLLCMLPEAEQKTVIDQYHEQIKCAVDTEKPGALFLAAYVYEKGMFVNRDTDLAFSYYLHAAKAGNDAAKARIGMAPIGDYQYVDECRSFFRNSVDTIGLAEYFMGWFLADDPDVMVVTEDILYFYELAANSGVMPAIRELAEVYMSGNSYIDPDPAKAIMWYEKLSDIDDDTAVKLANYYLDGKGCITGPESDAKALALLKKTVEMYENGTAYNNLAWMYKMGRGCEAPDFAKALRLFEKAAALECKGAFYHLGDIYEHGLGVKPDRKKAWTYYQRGAELGHQKCTDIVNRGPLQEEKTAPNDQVLSMLTDIQTGVSEIKASNVRIEQSIHQLLNLVEHDLNAKITAVRKKLQDCSEKDDATVAEFIEQTSTYINQAMVSVDTLVEQEEKHLMHLFARSWERLLDSTKASLISAGVLWKNCAGITKPDFDFSGVCISATSALEMELRHIFYTGFQSFIEDRYGTPSDETWETTFLDWPELLLSCSKYEFEKKKKTLSKGNYFTMGNLPYIMGKPGKYRNQAQECLLKTRLAEYLRTIVKEIYLDDPIAAFYNPDDADCFVCKCDFINKAYRIPAAHVDVIERDQADACYQHIVGRVDALKYTFDVTGLIIELYDKLK